MKRLILAENNPQQGWGAEQKLNRHTYPALKELDNLTNSLKDFTQKDISKVDFEGDTKRKEIFLNSFHKVLTLIGELKALFRQYSARKQSYLRHLSKTFNQEHFQKIGLVVATVQKVLSILVQARQYLPQERYLKGKELLTSLLEEVKNLQTFVQKM